MNRRPFSIAGPVALAMAALMVGGCMTAGPDYKRPVMAYPDYRNTPKTQAVAQVQTAPGGSWWTVFGDTTLNRLEEQALADNPTLVAAADRVAEARAQLGIAQADTRFSATANSTATLASQGAEHTIPIPGHSLSYRTSGDSYDLGFGASYEVDLWGRVRRSLQSARAQVSASEADEQAARLLLCADLAQTYFSYRELEREAGIVARDTAMQRDNLAVLQARQRGGLSTGMDVEMAKTELATTEADAADLARRRSQAFDALAVLSGRSPAELADLGKTAKVAAPPIIPAGVPSETLRRRPDVAAAEEQLRARTAEIGVAIANRYPSIKLTGGAGFDSLALRTLLSEPSKFWQVAPTLTGPLLDGGRGKAAVAVAKAQANAALADYRSQCLSALRDVEDALVALRQEADQGEALQRALASSQAATQLANERYAHGLTNYLNVLDARRSALQVERSLCQVDGARLSGTVQLIKALGGGWN